MMRDIPPPPPGFTLDTLPRPTPAPAPIPTPSKAPRTGGMFGMTGSRRQKPADPRTDDELFNAEVDRRIARGDTRQQLDDFATADGQVPLSGYPGFEAKMAARGKPSAENGVLSRYIRNAQSAARAGTVAGTQAGTALGAQFQPQPVAPGVRSAPLGKGMTESAPAPRFNFDGTVTVGDRTFPDEAAYRAFRARDLLETAKGPGNAPVNDPRVVGISISSAVDAALGLNKAPAPTFGDDGSVTLGDRWFPDRERYQRFNRETALALTFGTTPNDPKLNDNDAYRRAYRKVFGEEAPHHSTITADADGAGGKDAARDTKFGALDAFVRGAADVPTLGGMDELAAGLDTLTSGGRYVDNLKAQRGTDERDERVNPYARLGGQLSGSLLLPTGVGGAGRTAATGALRAGLSRETAIEAAKAATTRRMAAEGAAFGGAYGFGSANGDVGDRLKAAGTGAVFGGATGGALGVTGLGQRTPRLASRYRPAGPSFAPRLPTDVAARVADRIERMKKGRAGDLVDGPRMAPIDMARPATGRADLIETNEAPPPPAGFTMDAPTAPVPDRTLYHGSVGQWQAKNPSDLGMTFYAEDLKGALRYAQPASGGRRAKTGDGSVRAQELPPNARVLDLTTPEGLEVLSKLPAKGRLSSIIVGDARRDLARIAKGENSNLASGSFWTLTKRAEAGDAAGIRQDIADALADAGYAGVRFQDDSHTSVAVFDRVRAGLPGDTSAPVADLMSAIDRGGYDAGASLLGSLRRPTSRMAMEAEDDIPTLTADIPAERVVDRIDVGNPPPPPEGFTLDAPNVTGRPRPMGDMASPEEMARLAQGVRPGDVRPIPSNAVESVEEAAALSEGMRPRLPATDERKGLGTRYTPSTRDPSRMLPRKGPIDLVGFLRAEGGIRDQGGELRAMGIGNDVRPLDFAQAENRMGRLVSGDGMTLDDAAQRAWEAGYFPNHPERPTIAEFLEAVGATHSGSNRSFLPDDLAEVAAFEGARDQRIAVERAREAGSPLADDIGQPISQADLDRNAPPVTAYEDLPKIGGRIGNINLANIETRGDIRRLLQDTERRMGGFEGSRRGRISRAETEALASELGMTANDLLRRRQGQALNAEEALAARQLLAKSSDELVRMAGKVRGDNSEDLIAFQQAWLRHAAIQEQVSGAAAEAGRALAQFKQLAKASAVRGVVLDTRLGVTGGAERIKEAAERIIDLQRRGVPPGAITSFATKALKPKWTDKLVELWYNSLLSGPQTHAVNTLSNTMTSLFQLPEHAAAAALGQLRRGSADRVLSSEIGARAVGMIQGARQGITAFGRTLRTGDVPDLVTKVESRSQKAISGVKGEIIRTPSRMLAAEDEFFKAVARRMELSGLAVRKAHDEGLKGDALKKRIADLTDNPTDEMVAASLDYARYLTYQRPLGEFGRNLSQMTQSMGGLPKLVVPFVRTPLNIFKFTAERSPAAPFVKEWRADMRAGGARRDLAISKVVLGTGLGALVMSWASQGIITGSAPLDKNAERLMRADGWQPNSVRIGDQYYSYQRLDPLAMTLGVAADLATKGEHMTPKQADKAASLLLASIMSNLADKTWLSGISDFTAALDQPDRRLSSFGGKTLGSILVPAIVAQGTRTIDPVQREMRSPLDYVRNRIPGLSSTLPAKRDVWGKEIVREGGVGPDFMSPIWTQAARNDPLNKEMIDIGARFGPLKRDIKGVPLTGHQYSEYSRIAGQKAEAGIRAAMAAPSWRELSDEGKAKMVKSIRTKASAEARGEVMKIIVREAMTNGVLNLRDEVPSTNIDDRTGAPQGGDFGDIPPPPPGFEITPSRRRNGGGSSGAPIPPPPPGFRVD